jgi:NOL1/NOP2/fmu family ribosome biogenesis protein
MSDDEPVDDETVDGETVDESSGDGSAGDEADTETNDGQQFDRLPETAAERVVEGRATREAVLDWWAERFGIDPELFAEHSFWEKGAGKIWAFSGEMPEPARDVESLGMTFLRTRQEHWKPTTDAAQRFGRHASKNTISLSDDEASAFVAGEDQDLEWDGDWGYVIPTHDLAGREEPLGVGLYVYGELRSVVPKGRQRDV